MGEKKAKPKKHQFYPNLCEFTTCDIFNLIKDI